MAQGKTLWQGLAGGMLRLMGRLPLSFHHAMAHVTGWFVRVVVRYRRDVVKDNLQNSFPEKSAQELKAIEKKFYAHFGRIFTEALWYGSCKGDRGRKRLKGSHIVEIANPEEFNRILRDNTQVMILQTHAGNWELIGGILNYTYSEPLLLTTHTFAITYLPLHSQFWDRFMRENRDAPVRDMDFDGYIPTNKIVRHVQEHAGKKFCYCFITDQFPYSYSHKHTVEFMHRETPTMTGGAALACRMDMAVVYLRFAYREEGGYRMEFVPITEHAGSIAPMDIMKQYYKLLEEDLRNQPWNYLWTHKRWK